MIRTRFINLNTWVLEKVALGVRFHSTIVFVLSLGWCSIPGLSSLLRSCLSNCPPNPIFKNCLLFKNVFIFQARFHKNPHNASGCYVSLVSYSTPSSHPRHPQPLPLLHSLFEEIGDSYLFGCPTFWICLSNFISGNLVYERKNWGGKIQMQRMLL